MNLAFITGVYFKSFSHQFICQFCFIISGTSLSGGFSASMVQGGLSPVNFRMSSPGREWQDSTSKSSSITVSNNGKRYVVLHCGGENGCVAGASLVFKSKSNEGDYHGEMNGANFMTWCAIQLAPHITEDTLLTLDNASYHKTKVSAYNTCINFILPNLDAASHSQNV